MGTIWHGSRHSMPLAVALLLGVYVSQGSAFGQRAPSPVRRSEGGLIDIVSYGADPSGKADSTSAIQNALNATLAVYASAGSYKITATLKMRSHSTLTCSGPYSTVFIGALNSPLIQSVNPAVTATGISIENCGFNDTSSGNTGSVGIDFTNVNAGRVSNVRIDNVETGLQTVSVAFYNTLEGVTIRNAGIGYLSNAGANTMIGGSVGLVNTCFSLAESTYIGGTSCENFSTGLSVSAGIVSLSGVRFENRPTSGVAVNLSGGQVVDLGSYFNVGTKVAGHTAGYVEVSGASVYSPGAYLGNYVSVGLPAGALAQNTLHLGPATLGTGLRIGNYVTIGESRSAGSLVVGNNVEPSKSSADELDVMTSHNNYGARALKLTRGGLAFCAKPGQVTAGDVVSACPVTISDTGVMSVGASSSGVTIDPVLGIRAPAFINSLTGNVVNTAAPLPHAAAHRDGGGDEIATVVPGPGSIPKAGLNGALASGWLPADTCVHTKYTIDYKDLLLQGGTASKTLFVAGSPEVRLCSVEISGTASFAGAPGLTGATVYVGSSASAKPMRYSPDQDIYGLLGPNTNNYWSSLLNAMDRVNLGVVAYFTFLCGTEKCYTPVLMAGSVDIVIGTYLRP